MIGHYEPQNHAPCVCEPPLGTKDGGRRVWMALPFPFAAAMLSSLPTAVTPVHTRLCGSLALPVPAVVQSTSRTVRSLGPVGQALLAQAPGFAEESSDAHHGPAAASVPALHPCSGRAVWPLLHEADRYTAGATGTGKPRT